MLGRALGSLPRGAAARTLTAWVRSRGGQADSAAIFQYGSVLPDADRFWLGVNQSGHASFGSRAEFAGRERVDDGKWHFLAGVFEGGASRRYRIFVDGRESGSAAAETEPLSPAGETLWAIGRGIAGGTAFRGEVDDVRVYEHALRPEWVHALYRCRVYPPDVESGGRKYHLSPIFGVHTQFRDGVLTNAGTDHGGATFVELSKDCELQRMRASDMGQDLKLDVELRVLGAPQGPLSEAGPFFRCRRSAPGDGIVGGESAGFWVRLHSNGQVSVRRLHPVGVVAFTTPIEGFDPRQFHGLSVVARGEKLQVRLDGRLLEFDQGGVRRTEVEIPPRWETAEPRGENRGSAGIAFGCSQNRGQVTGQQARAIRIAN